MQIANCQPNAHQKELGQKPNGILMLPTKIKIILAHLSVCVRVCTCVCVAHVLLLALVIREHTLTLAVAYQRQTLEIFINYNVSSRALHCIFAGQADSCLPLSPCLSRCPLCRPCRLSCYPPMTCSWNNNKAFAIAAVKPTNPPLLSAVFPPLSVSLSLFLPLSLPPRHKRFELGGYAMWSDMHPGQVTAVARLSFAIPCKWLACKESCMCVAGMELL